MSYFKKVFYVDLTNVQLFEHFLKKLNFTIQLMLNIENFKFSAITVCKNTERFIEKQYKMLLINLNKI